MSANELIFAIQSCNAETLRKALEQANDEADMAVAHLKQRHRKWERKNPVNERSTLLDVTPLHVASKAFSAHAGNRELSKAFNQMVQMLLDADGNPYLEAGAVMKRTRVGDRFVCVYVPGKTAVELCNGVVPPALQAWIAKRTAAAKTTVHDSKRAYAGQEQSERELSNMGGGGVYAMEHFLHSASPSPYVNPRTAYYVA